MEPGSGMGYISEDFQPSIFHHCEEKYCFVRKQCEIFFSSPVEWMLVPIEDHSFSQYNSQTNCSEPFSFEASVSF